MRRMCSMIGIVLCTISGIAQPAVRNEPRHHNVFENGYVRILDVFLPPHDTTQFHVHNTPSVFNTFTKTATGSQLINGQPTRDVSVAGNSWYDNLVTPRTHRVWNEDTNWFHVMDIELIGGKPHSAPSLLQNSLLQLFFNAPLANGYHLQLAPDNSIELPVSRAGYLILSNGDVVTEYKVNGSNQLRNMKSGHYIWIDPGSQFSMTSRGKATANFLVLQLK